MNNFIYFYCSFNIKLKQTSKKLYNIVYVRKCFHLSTYTLKKQKQE